MGIRLIKIVLSLSLALWGLIAGAMNLVDYENGVSYVFGVISIGGADSLRAINSPALAHLGYAFIYLGKFATGILCGMGTINLWTARHSEANDFNRAKSNTYLGCGIALFMLFFGFIVVAGSLFTPIEFDAGRTLFHQYALFYAGFIGLIALYIGMPDQEL